MAEERIEPCEALEAVKSEAITNRENFEKNLASRSAWGYSELGNQAQKAAMTMLSTKTGMYARIPLLCKADDCPYHESCQLLPYNLAPVGEFCPVETAQIEMRYAGYDHDFGIDKSSFTDRNLILEIIHWDIMLERCKALIAKQGVPVEQVFAGVSEQGELYTRPEISKFLEAYERASKKRNEAYQLMMATRKDKRKDDQDKEESLMDMLSKMGADGFVIDKKPSHLIDVTPR